MFLDDKLIKICVEADINTPNDVQQVFDELINTCQDHFKSRLKPDMTNKEVKSLIDNTFNSWSSFVRIANTYNSIQVVIFGILGEKHTFRDIFLKDEKMSSLYNSL